MKRPLALIGLSYFFTLTFLVFLPNNFLVPAIIILGVLSLASVFFIKKSRVLFLTFLPCLIASIVYYVNLNYNIIPTEKWDDCTVTINGEICDNVFKKNSAYHYIINVKNINGEDVKPFKIEVSSAEPIECETFDTITSEAYLFIPPANPGFNSKLHYRSKNIYLKGFLTSNDKTLKIEESNNRSFKYFVLKIRKKLLSTSKENLPPEYAAIINGIMLGDKNDFPKNTKRNFDIIGAYHLLAVSGIHISIVAFFILKFLIALKVKDKIAYIATMLFVMGFVFVAGFTPSSVRAGIMMGIYLMSLCLRKSSDSLTAIGIAVGTICIFNPNSAIDIGLWLSFLSILSITLFYSKLTNFILSYIPKKLNNPATYFLISSFTMSMCCFLLDVPVSSWYFKKISTVSFISNVLIVTPVSIILALSLIMNILTCINYHIFMFIIKPLALICGFMIKYVNYASSLIAKIPNALLNSNYGYLRIAISMILILVIITILSSGTKNIIVVASIVSINLIMVSIISYEYFTKNVTQLAVIPCGEGLCISISKNHHKALLLSTTEKTFSDPIEYEFSTSNRNLVDYFSLSMSSQKDIPKFIDIINTYEPKNIVIDEKNQIISEKLSENIKKIINKTHSYTTIFGNTKIETITKNSYVYIKINIDNIKFLVVPNGGNANDIPENWTCVDCFICGGLPQNYNKINFKNIIISDSKRASEIYLFKLARNYKNIFSSYHQGNIYINVNSDGNNYQIRRIM